MHEHAPHPAPHHHGHEHDQGLAGHLRYLRRLPAMWRSPERRRARRNEPHFEEVDIGALAAELIAAGFSSAQGTRGVLAGRPAKLVRAVR